MSPGLFWLAHHVFLCDEVGLHQYWDRLVNIEGLYACVRGNDAYFLLEHQVALLWAVLKLVTGEGKWCGELTRESCQVTNPQSLIKAPAMHICCLHAYASPVTSAALAPQRGDGNGVYLLPSFSSPPVSFFFCAVQRWSSGLEREEAEHQCTMRWMVQAIKGNGGTMFRVASFRDFCLIQVYNVKSTQRAINRGRWLLW